MAPTPQVSVVVPLYEEEGNVTPLVETVRASLGPDPSWELVLVDDGSGDGTADVAARHAREDERVRLLRLARNYGQTQALQAGFDHARGRIVVSMDGDLQNDPRDIPEMIRKLEEGYDLVAGYRRDRKDRMLTRTLPSTVANALIRWITGVPIRDNGCALRVYRREVVERMHLYSDMHRFIPALAATVAGARITQVPVRHHPRRHGESKYGLSRIWKVLADLLTIKMIHSFREHPLAMFFLMATPPVLLGLVFSAGTLFHHVAPSVDIVALVFPAAAAMWFGLAAYLVMLGLVAEVAVREHAGPITNGVPVVRERRPA